MAEEKIDAATTDAASDKYPSKDDLQNAFSPSSDKKTALPPGKVAEALQGKLQSVVEKQVATETPSPGAVRDEMDKTQQAIADHEFLYGFAGQVATLYADIKTDVIRFEKSDMPLMQLMDALLNGTSEKVEQYGKQVGDLSPMLVGCVKSARSLKDGLTGFSEALVTIGNDQNLPPKPPKGKAAANNARAVIEAAIFKDDSGSLSDQVTTLCKAFNSANNDLKKASQKLHIAFDAEDMKSLYQAVLDQAEALQKHLEEKATATSAAEQALTGTLVELRTQLLTQLVAEQAASGGRQRLLDHKRLTRSFADTLNMRWGKKKEGDKQESAVPASLGQQQKELNEKKEAWENAQAAVAALQVDIQEEGSKADLLNGHRNDLAETQKQLTALGKALAKAKDAFTQKNKALRSTGTGQPKAESSRLHLDDLVAYYGKLLGYVQQMEKQLSAVLLHSEEFGDDPLVAALAPLKEQMDGLAEPAGGLLDQLLAAQFTLDEVRGTLDDVQENLTELERQMNGSDALLTNIPKLALNKELDKAIKSQEKKVGDLEKALANQEKEEAKAEEAYETAQAEFDFEMMLTDG